RDVGDVCLAHERRHVMLAMRREWNIADQPEVVVAADLGKRALEHVERTLAVAPEQLLIGAHDPPRRVAQAFAGRIIARKRDQRLDRGFGLLARGFWAHRRRRRAHVLRELLLGKGFQDRVHTSLHFGRRYDRAEEWHRAGGPHMLFLPAWGDHTLHSDPAWLGG